MYKTKKKEKNLGKYYFLSVRPVVREGNDLEIGISIFRYELEGRRKKCMKRVKKLKKDKKY